MTRAVPQFAIDAAITGYGDEPFNHDPVARGEASSTLEGIWESYVTRG